MVLSVSSYPEVNGISTKPEAEVKKPRHKRTFPSFFAKSSSKQAMHDEYQKQQKTEVSTSNKNSTGLTKPTPERYHKPKPDLPHLNIPSATHDVRHPMLIIPKTPAVNVKSTKDSIRDLGLSGAVVVEQPMISGGNAAPLPVLFGDGIPTFSSTSSSKSSPSLPSSSVTRSVSISERAPPRLEPRPRLLSGNLKHVTRPLPAIPRSVSASPLGTSSSHVRRPATASDAIYGTSIDKGHGSVRTMFPGTVHANSAILAGKDKGHVPGHSVSPGSARINNTIRGMHDRARHGLPPLPITIPPHHHHTWSVPETSPPPIHSTHSRPRTGQHGSSLKQSAVPVDLHCAKIPEMIITSRERIRPNRHPDKLERGNNPENKKVSSIAKQTNKALPAPPTSENCSPERSLQVPPTSTEILVHPPPPDVVVCMPSPIPDSAEESISRPLSSASSDPGFVSNGSNTTSPLPVTPSTGSGETLQTVQVSDGTNTPKSSPGSKNASRRLGIAPPKSPPQSTPPSPSTRRPKLGRTGPANTASNPSPAWPWAPPASWSGPTLTQSDSDAPPSRDEKEESKQTRHKLPRLRKQKSAPKVAHKERKTLYTHLNLSTPSMWQPPMPKGWGEEEEEEYGVLVARTIKGTTHGVEDVVVTMQNMGGEVWEKDMADVIPQLRQLKTSKKGKH